MSRRLAGISIAVIILIYAFWFFEAGNFSDSNVPGTYEVRTQEETSVLMLRPDHTFHQQLRSAGVERNAEGTWRLFPKDSQGHIVLSHEFLKLSDQKTNSDGAAYGMLKNQFGLLSIIFEPHPGGPIFRKRLFD